MSFEEIYHAYFQDVYLYIRSLTHDENIAEEITQEAFFKALKSIESFNGTKDIRAWLFTIARNTYFSYYKKKGSGANLECCQNTHKNMRLITNIQSLQSIKIRIFILIPEQLIHIKM
ncbi:RNA polymerase sigma factor [Bacillus pseudomycoides]|uniref:RNA polymerase sigma factor n=1 Tax=Bacillus pseudomycoides TaxID=64104 RepID=UPI0020D2738B|nr:RNA polymerase sigma factor [Bacillus pseudomycoides]